MSDTRKQEAVSTFKKLNMFHMLGKQNMIQARGSNKLFPRGLSEEDTEKVDPHNDDVSEARQFEGVCYLRPGERYLCR